MSAFSRGLAALGLACAAIAGGVTERAARATEPVSQGGQTVKVHLDQAKLLKVPDGTSTLVVGNHLIADVAVQSGGTLVVTGKGYGNTNLVALDRSGSVIMEHQVQVQGPLGSIVVVYRGVERESYSCTPDCERRITLGDTQNYFAATLGQSGSLNSQAQGGGTPAK
jgi:Flp pilus assembly secretin CpaC